ncbi:MAG: hypothetical protein ACM3ZB_14530 [bacterium]|jgi:hypothetical protein
MPKKGSMDRLTGDDRKAANRGVPGAFGKKDIDPRPPSGDKHSSIQENRDPFEGEDRGGRKHER